MARLAGVGKLQNKLEELKDLALEVRESLDVKRDWLEGKSERYLDSEAGQAWQEHLDQVESLLDDIDNLDDVE